MFHLDAHDYFAADRYLGPAAKLHGDTPVVMYHYGRNLYFLGRFKEALAALQRARELGAGRETYPLIDYLDGLCQMRLGQNDEAIQSLQTYLKWAYEQTTLTRVEVDAHLKLADLLDHKGKRFEAMKEKQKADDLRARIDAWARQQEARSPSQATEPPGTAPTPAPAGGGTAPAAAPTAPAPAAPPPPGR
jgi:tetratricopeptide (TPR) repeat protein